MHPKALAVIAARGRHPGYEPLYETDPRTGATIEVFHADPVLAASFGASAGWYWWSCHRGSRPGRPHGPFHTAYRAYGDALNQLQIRSCEPKRSADHIRRRRRQEHFPQHYRCASCGFEWTDVWSCQCDDDCP
jgi:hypothetical protein